MSFTTAKCSQKRRHLHSDMIRGAEARVCLCVCRSVPMCGPFVYEGDKWLVWQDDASQG